MSLTEQLQAASSDINVCQTAIEMVEALDGELNRACLRMTLQQVRVQLAVQALDACFGEVSDIHDAAIESEDGETELQAFRALKAIWKKLEELNAIN